MENQFVPKKKKMNKENEFYFVIADDKDKVFNIMGPMPQNSDLIDTICELQKGGQKINCALESAGQDRKELIQRYSDKLAYNYVDRSLLTPKNFTLDLNT